jgi:hypothetical protein
MCHVADKWNSNICLEEAFRMLSSSDNVITKMEELISVLSWLPNSVSALPQYLLWEQRWLIHNLAAFLDVRSLLCNYKKLQQFRKLPFLAVRSWADNDELVIDSENSVAVAISWWFRGEQGQKCSDDQQKQLSGLLRVQHLTNGAWWYQCA